MTEEASRFVGSIPEHYDAGLGPHIFEGYAEDLAGRVAALDPAAVLELAAGTGIVTRRLRDVLPAGCDIVASDLNQPMLDFAEAKFAPDESVGFEVADATDLPWQDERFDVVTCQFGVMFFPDKHRSYAEARRVLRAGGHYVFNVWDAWPFNAFAEITHDVVAGFFPDDPPRFLPRALRLPRRRGHSPLTARRRLPGRVRGDGPADVCHTLGGELRARPGVR